METAFKFAFIAVFVVLFSAAILGLIVAPFVYLAWNAVMPDVFGLSTITLWQAFLLTVIARLLIPVSNGGSKSST